MKFYTNMAIILLFTSEFAFAGSYTKDELNVYFQKHRACDLALAVEHTDTTAKLKKYLGSMIFCVADVTMEVGTIKESKGCMFAIYDTEKSNYKTTFSNSYRVRDDPRRAHKSGFAMVEGVKCDAAGLEKLSNAYAGFLYGKNVSVGITRGYDYGCFIGGQCGAPYVRPQEVVYARTPEIEAWWRALEEKYLAEKNTPKKAKKTK